MAEQSSNQKQAQRWTTASTGKTPDWEGIFLRLGSVRDPNDREVARRALSETGLRGARWLIQRIRQEHDLERLYDVAGVLARMGNDCIIAILDGLEDCAASDQAWVLPR
jgi:hypothetical protein